MRVCRDFLDKLVPFAEDLLLRSFQARQHYEVPVDIIQTGGDAARDFAALRLDFLELASQDGETLLSGNVYCARSGFFREFGVFF